MSNPYDPPATTTTTPSEANAQPNPWAVLAFVVGVMFVGAAIYLQFLAYALRKDFPELHDPSPQVDGYWPAVVHFIYQLLSGLSGLIAAICLVIARLLRHRQLFRGRPSTGNRDPHSGR